MKRCQRWRGVGEAGVGAFMGDLSYGAHCTQVPWAPEGAGDAPCGGWDGLRRSATGRVVGAAVRPAPGGRPQTRKARFRGPSGIGCEGFPGTYCFTASTWTMTLMSFEKPYWMP